MIARVFKRCPFLLPYNLVIWLYTPDRDSCQAEGRAGDGENALNKRVLWLPNVINGLHLVNGETKNFDNVYNIFLFVQI